MRYRLLILGSNIALLPSLGVLSASVSSENTQYFTLDELEINKQTANITKTLSKQERLLYEIKVPQDLAANLTKRWRLFYFPNLDGKGTLANSSWSWSDAKNDLLTGFNGVQYSYYTNNNSYYYFGWNVENLKSEEANKKLNTQSDWQNTRAVNYYDIAYFNENRWYSRQNNFQDTEKYNTLYSMYQDNYYTNWSSQYLNLHGYFKDFVIDKSYKHEYTKYANKLEETYENAQYSKVILSQNDFKKFISNDVVLFQAENLTNSIFKLYGENIDSSFVFNRMYVFDKSTFNNLSSYNDDSDLKKNVLKVLKDKNNLDYDTDNLIDFKMQNDYEIELDFDIEKRFVSLASNSNQLEDSSQYNTIYNQREHAMVFVPKIKIYAPKITVSSFNKNVDEKNKAIEDFSSAFSYAKNRLKQLGAINVESDKLGYLGGVENQEKVKAKIDEINQSLQDNGYKYGINFHFVSDNKIDIQMLASGNNFEKNAYPIAKNFPIKVGYSTKAISTDLKDRLKIRSNKWVDFEGNSTNLKDDIPEKIADEKKINEKSFYGGKWLYHAPAKVNFFSPKESETLFINGKRIEVLDKSFEEILEDKRKLIVDNSFNNSEEETEINTYKIEIKKYLDGLGNSKENLEYTWSIDIIINANALTENYVYYAWEPSKNKSQRDLISKYLIGDNGKELKDEKGNFVPNPKYDKEINPVTGTKKELVWVDLENDVEIIGSSDYELKTNLPFSTKTLLAKNGNRLIRGFIAEASVLGKGALQQIDGVKSGASQYRYFKINQNDLSNGRFSYEIINDNKKYADLPLATGEDSYFSNSGLWLFTSHAQRSIDNYKIVLIDENLNAQKEKLSNIITTSKFKNLWNSNIGIELMLFIQSKYHLDEEYIKSLSYEKIMQYFMLFINDNYKKYETQSFLKEQISITFKDIPQTFTKADFVNRYIKTDNKDLFLDDFLNEKQLKNLIYISNIFLDEDNILHITIALKPSFITGYELNQNQFTSEIAFVGEPIKTSKRTINLFLNKEKVLESINYLTKDTVKTLRASKEWFNNLSQADFGKLDFDLSYNLNEIDSLLNITVGVKKQFAKHYKVDKNEFKIHFNWNALAINLEKNELGIFAKIEKIDNLNIKGIEDREKIKEKITNYIKEKLSAYQLEIDRDYQLINIDVVVEKLLNIQYLEDKLNAKYYNLLIKAKSPKKGTLQVGITNYLMQEINNIIDLSKLKVSPINLTSQTSQQLNKELILKTTKLLQEHKIKFESVILSNFDSVLNALINGSEETNLIIESNHPKIINSLVVKVQHNSKITKDLIINRKLSDIKLDKLILSSKIFEELQHLIINYVKNELAIYNYIYNKDYYIENINSIEYLFNLVTNKKLSLNIISKANSEEKTKLDVENNIDELTDRELEEWNNLIKESKNTPDKKQDANDSNDEEEITNFVNLASLSINALVLFEDNPKTIKDKIYAYLDNFFESKQMDKNAYILKKNQLDTAIYKLLKVANHENIATINLFPNYGYSFGKTELVIKNTTAKANDKSVDVTVREVINKSDFKQKQANKQRKTKIITTSTILFLTLIFTAGIGTYLYIRKVKSKVK